MNNYDFRNDKAGMNLVLGANSQKAAEIKARQTLKIKSLAKHHWKLAGESVLRMEMFFVFMTLLLNVIQYASFPRSER